MAKFHQGKAFKALKKLYIIEKEAIAEFPDDNSIAITDTISEPFEEIKFLPNTGTIAITPQTTNHGTFYNVTINCQLNKLSITTSRDFDKYKFKELIAVVEDFDGNKILIGGSSPEQFCKLTFGFSLGSTNIYSVNITAQSADYPPFYTGGITTQ